MKCERLAQPLAIIGKRRAPREAEPCGAPHQRGVRGVPRQARGAGVSERSTTQQTAPSQCGVGARRRRSRRQQPPIRGTQHSCTLRCSSGGACLLAGKSLAGCMNESAADCTVVSRDFTILLSPFTKLRSEDPFDTLLLFHTALEFALQDSSASLAYPIHVAYMYLTY